MSKTAKQALDEIFSVQRNLLIRTLLRIVGNAAVAEELAHETYIRAHTAVRNRHVEYVQPFLYRTAHNLALDHLRADRRRPTVSDDGLEEGEMAEAPTERRSPEVDVQGRQLLAHVESTLAGLSKRQQEVLVLAKLKGWTYGEIANHLGVSNSTVQKELKVAIMACRRTLTDLGEF